MEAGLHGRRLEVREIHVLPDADSVASAAADTILHQAQSTLADNLRFNLVLAGGSTPQTVYRLLASQYYATQIDWSRVQVFFGDERCVPPSHPDSNYLMARRALLDHVPIPDENVHRMPGELNPPQAALEYEKELRQIFPEVELPGFDLLLLGMGEDGHVASLFPGSEALDEEQRWVVAIEQVGGEEKGLLKGRDSHLMPPLVNRLSLTLPVLNASLHVLFLVTGVNKASRLSQVFREMSTNAPLLPVQLIQPHNQQVLWLVDEAAGSEIRVAGKPEPPTGN